MRETYAVTILDQKTKRLRKETGNEKLRSALDTGRSPQELFRLAIVRPSKMLAFSPIVLLFSLYMAIIYGYLYLIFTAMPALFENQYGFSTGSVGLAYIGIGVGSLIGLLIAGALSDPVVRMLTKRYGGEPKPEYRLPALFLASLFVPLGLFLFGWTAEKNYHWFCPILGTAFLGLGMIAAFVCRVAPELEFSKLVFILLTIKKMPISVYLVDAYGLYSASAIAASTVLRSLLGALLPLAGRRLYMDLGLGWGTSLLAFISVVMIPVPIVFWTQGERIRNYTFFHAQF